MIPAAAGLLLLAAAQDAVTAGELRTHATLHSIGVEWDLSGDADHDATCAVQFRVQGSGPWKKAMPLFRVDYRGWYDADKADRAYNMVAGSILFLEPGTAWEVKLDLSDPDGGSASKTFTIRTRPVPALPRDGRAFHVIPGEGGGSGSPASPFKGLRAAHEAARPGDVFLLHKGSYGGFELKRGGEPGRPIAWKGAGDGDPEFETLDLYGSHLWIEGLVFRNPGKVHRALKGQGAVAEAVVRRCRFAGFNYSILLVPECRDWVIEDNVIVGDQDPLEGGLGGEGVELGHSSGHVVAHNRISRVADGVSYPHRNCDIHGNDIFDVSDDAIEPDYGYANNRVWGNRMYNCKNHALSFQPMYCGPWYFIRNQSIGARAVFKFRVQDRFVLAHNTFVNWEPMSDRMHLGLGCFSRNNLYIMAGGGRPVWWAQAYAESRYALPDRFTPNWMTDIDHDGFDWGEAKVAFRWDVVRPGQYRDLESFSKAVGIEAHGVRVRKEEIFESYAVPEKPGPVGPMILALRKGSAAVDAGVPVPNLNDGFEGRAPDLGAHECGKPSPVYGPRPETSR
jgi:hypothetical protein